MYNDKVDARAESFTSANERDVEKPVRHTGGLAP